MSVAQDFWHAVLKFITVIFGLWCIYLSYDKTPLAEFEVVGDAAGWSWMAAALSLLLMTPFYYLDKHLQNSRDHAPSRETTALGTRMVTWITLVLSIAAMLSLAAFGITLSGFLLAKSYVIIRPFL